MSIRTESCKDCSVSGSATTSKSTRNWLSNSPRTFPATKLVLKTITLDVFGLLSTHLVATKLHTCQYTSMVPLRLFSAHLAHVVLSLILALSAQMR
jgi:hypothetical protein